MQNLISVTDHDILKTLIMVSYAVIFLAYILITLGQVLNLDVARYCLYVPVHHIILRRCYGTSRLNKIKHCYYETVLWAVISVILLLSEFWMFLHFIQGLLYSKRKTCILISLTLEHFWMGIFILKTRAISQSWNACHHFTMLAWYQREMSVRLSNYRLSKGL